MSKSDIYIEFEKPMTLEEYSSEEGQARMRNAINVHRELHKAEDKKQESAAAQRSEAANRIRAAFQKKAGRERGENECER
jgi:hypothetical protein